MVITRREAVVTQLRRKGVCVCLCACVCARVRRSELWASSGESLQRLSSAEVKCVEQVCVCLCCRGTQSQLVVKSSKWPVQQRTPVSVAFKHVDPPTQTVRAGERTQRLRIPPARGAGQDRPVHPAGGARHPRRRGRAPSRRPPGVRERGERGGREPPAGRRQDKSHHRGSGAHRGGRRHHRAAEETRAAGPERVRHGGDPPARRGQRLGAGGHTEQRHPEGGHPCPAGERGHVLAEVGQAECQLQHQGTGSLSVWPTAHVYCVGFHLSTHTAEYYSI